MAIPSDIFLYAIWDKDNKSYYVGPDGSVNLSAQPKFLKHKPIGWAEVELSFDTVDKYFSNVKSLSVPLQYVLDGAQIIRWLLYRGKGVYEEAYCVILKWNPNTGIHELEYKGRIDFTKAIDDVEIGITVNATEGGLQADLDANEAVTYELPLDATNPGADKVYFDGVTLFDSYTYSTPDLPDMDVYSVLYHPQTLHAAQTPYIFLPFSYLSNEGDSVGVASGNQEYEPPFADINTLSTSANTGFQNLSPNEITIHVENTIHFGIKIKDWLASSNIHGPLRASFFVQDGNGGLTETLIQETDVYIDHTYALNLKHDVVIPPNGKLFIILRLPTELENVVVTDAFPDSQIHYLISFKEEKFKISFSSINPPSSSYSLTPLEIANQIVKKWNPKYSVVSNFLSTHNNIVATSGQSLRNLPNPVLKYSFKDFFDDFNFLYCLGINIIGNVMYIEQRKERYRVNTSTTIFDLGGVSSFKIKPGGKVFTTVKTGWPDQQYDERNGKYEFNSETEWKLPGDIKGEELNLIGKARGDCYGIEFIRGKLNNKDTTDNAGDNEVFLVNTTQRIITANVNIVFDPSTLFQSIITFDTTDNYFDFQVGDRIVLSGTNYNNKAYTIGIIGPITVNEFIVFVNEKVTTETASNVTVTLGKRYLKRETYDTYSGVPTATVFNVEEMTPTRKLLAWGSYFHSLLKPLDPEKITCQTTLKNKDLSTTLAGVTIAEKDNRMVALLDDPFFLNYDATFTTKVPLTFSKTLSNLLTVGNVKVNCNGFDIYLLPIGKMTSKPATNEAQEWTLTLSAFNDVATLYKLSQEGLYISDANNNTMNISVLNPVQWVYYNKRLNEKYKYKDLFDDWVHHRNDQFGTQPYYIQKWQFSDTISQQFITNGIGQLELYVYDAWAREMAVIPASIVSNPAIRTPYVLQQVDINPNDFGEGNFLFALKSNGVVLALSEWQGFAQTWEDTYAIEYTNSYNKLNAYFSSFTPMIRVEAMFGSEVGEGTSTDYQDEHKIQTLNFNTYTTKKLWFGVPYGIPDWMHIKLNNILFLDNMYIEGVRYTRPNDSKFEVNERSGIPLNVYSIDVRRYDSDMDFSVTPEGLTDTIGAIYTIDAEAYGQAPGVISVEID